MAAQDLRGFVLPQPNSPIQISSCESATRDLPTIDDTWVASCTIVNHDAQRRIASLVRFHIEWDDPFGAMLRSLDLDAEGEYAPDVSVKLEHNGGIMGQQPFWSAQTHGQIPHLVLFGVSRVLFTDGESYTANIAADAAAYLATHKPYHGPWYTNPDGSQ